MLIDGKEKLERMRLIRSHGMTGERKYWHQAVGHNFRLTNMQAAVAMAIGTIAVR
jgi:perosamine synthetase